jgi:uncharacterized protein YvpB
MFDNENSLSPTQDVSEISFDQISTQDFHRLLNKIFNGREIFEPGYLNELVEPDIYPVFDFGILGTPRAGLIATTQKNSYESTSHQFNYSRNPMTKIVVDPPVLQNCSKNIFNSATTLTSVGKNIISCANSAPSYEGQFGPKVRAIAAGASSQASQLSGRLNDLVGRLGTKAQQFLDVDNSSAGSLTYSMGGSALKTTFVSIFPPLSLLPFFGILEKLFPNGINLWNQVPGMISEPDQSQTVLFVAKATDTLNIRSGAGIGNQVIGQFMHGEMLQVIGFGISKEDGYTWVRVKSADGTVGWAAKEYLEYQGLNSPNASGKDKSQSPTNEQNISADDGILFINQVDAINIRNVDCGPSSLVMALSALGINVPGTTLLEKVTNARKSMATVIDNNGNRIVNFSNDGIDENGNFYLPEHQGESHYTNLNNVVNGANDLNANAYRVRPASIENLKTELQNEKKLVISGTFSNKTGLWESCSGDHIIAIVEYDSSRGFHIADPMTNGLQWVSEQQISKFMENNSGAAAISKKE